MNVDLIKRLRDVLKYDEFSGIFYWKVILSNRVKPGDIAGSVSNGYVWISIDGIRYPAHRLAWLFVYGIWPKGEVDHRYGDRGDNRIANLRDVSGSVNRQNVRTARSHNKSTGVLGVDKLPSGRYRAKVRHNGVGHYLGVFDTSDAAHQAYVIAKRKIHEGCTL